MTADRPQYGPSRGETRTPAQGDGPAPGTGWSGAALQPYRGQTYFGLPAIKPSHYGWLITAYFFVGGLASAAQFIATIVDLVGVRRDRPVTRAGRYLALAGALASPALLIADLHYPRRWFNMLRIYRDTSAMSIGSWALSIFGAFSGLTAFGQFLEDIGVSAGGWLARLFQLPAALAAAVVSLYTGTLVAATNMPLVSAAFPYLSSLFASSAASTATAALSLAVEASPPASDTRRRLDVFAVIAGISELTFALLIERNWRRRGVAGPPPGSPAGPAFRYGVLGAGIVAPIIVHAIQVTRRRPTRPVSIVAAVLTLVGGFILRAVFIFGGNQSGRHPRDYFWLAQPGNGR